MNCLLCDSKSAPFASEVFRCERCFLVFKNPTVFLTTEQDKSRYSHHLNHKEDPGYVEFLNRLINPLKVFLPSHFSALDFGCGPGPTMSFLLNELGADTRNYDPIFFPDKISVEQQYDLVTTTEVVEHFKNMKQDWDLLVGTVKKGGLLAVMTRFMTEETNYENWWYKNDPTHVVFYRQETFDFLCEKYNLSILFKDNQSVVIMRKN